MRGSNKCAALGGLAVLLATAGCSDATPTPTPGDTSEAASPAPTPTTITIAITSPPADSLVDPLETVTGEAQGAREIWVVVNPTATNQCWIQGSSPVVDGAWRLGSNFGEPGQHSGATFEIRAMASPAEPPDVGTPVPCWPEAQAYSNAVPVTRR